MGLMLGRILDETKLFLLDPRSIHTTLHVIDSSLCVRPFLISWDSLVSHPEKCCAFKFKTYRDGLGIVDYDDFNNINNVLHKLSTNTAEDELKVKESDSISPDSSQITVSLESYHIISPSCYLEPKDFVSPFGEVLSSSYATCPMGFVSHGLSLPSSSEWTFFDPHWCQLVDYKGSKQLLGEGSFGEVIKATCYGRETVVKRLKAGQRVCRVLWEADMTAYLGSFGVCPVLLGVIRSCEDTFNLPALVLEYVPRAEDMHHLMEEKGWTFYRLEMLDALAQAANLIEFLHKHRILHNDIKHSNFLMAPNPCYMGRQVQGVPPPPRRITPHWPSRFRVYLIDLANASYKGGTQLRMQGGVLLRYMAKFRLTHYLREVVRRCTQTIPDHRPSMRQVLLYLELLTNAQASNHDDDGHVDKQAIDEVIKRVWNVLYIPAGC